MGGERVQLGSRKMIGRGSNCIIAQSSGSIAEIEAKS